MKSLTKPTAAGLALALLTAAAAFSLPDDKSPHPSASGGSATRASAPLATGHLQTGQVAGDCNSDGIVDSRDLSVLLSGYGDAGFDPVAGGECTSWREWDDRERQFRESIADIPTAQGAPYPPMSGPIIRGDWDKSGWIDGPDLSVLLANFGVPAPR